MNEGCFASLAMTSLRGAFSATKQPSFLFFFIALLISSSLHAETSDAPGKFHFQQALTAIQEEELDEAEQHFKEALLLEPMNAEYRFELANLYALRRDEFDRTGDHEGAQQKLEASAQELKQAVMAKPDFLPAHFNLGIVNKNLGRYEEARKEFKEVLRIDPSQTPAMLQIGATYEEQGFYDDAETIYQDLLERYPGHPALQEALNGLAQRRVQSNRDEMAQRQRRQMALGTGLSSLANSQQRQQTST